MKESGTKWIDDEKYLRLFKKCCTESNTNLATEDDKKVFAMFVDNIKLSLGRAECLLCNIVEENPEITDLNLMWHYFACRRSWYMVNDEI